MRHSTHPILRHLQPAMAWRHVLWASLGSFLAIAALSWVGNSVGSPILIAAFGSSCVLVFLLPSSPMAQPVSLVGGHLVSACCGLLVRTYLPSAWWSIALAVGLSIAAMALLRVTHPPAGGNPIGILLANEGWSYLVVTVLLGSLIVAVCGMVFRVFPLAKSESRAEPEQQITEEELDQLTR
ncbi:hypothetical protein CQ017_15310 [Arthrobacter sp. MYb224]|uniref:HPP family protein n=1 Tax=Arthrobacter sp. MYb224 TaxID=1848600 RepID=UPI000CFD6151|nr:HPP family protein [Arthrobacter sp. MYb224]PQZ96991.1 hypothetical protein CQ017_15310 [Arthrobacter sp. MYb224]